VIVIYNIRRQNTRQTAIEVLKMRGIKHQKKIVSMNITDKGIVVYPNKEIYSEIE
jgi:KaiC/GvpD/RAD55 family RecA-like ATPase